MVLFCYLVCTILFLLSQVNRDSVPLENSLLGTFALYAFSTPF